jgi:hypothetical protein
VLWGVGQFALGPAGGTIQNVGRGIQYIISAPPGAKGETTVRSAISTMDRELVASRQWGGVFQRMLHALEGEEPRYFQVNRVRQRAFEWLDRENVAEEGWTPYLTQQALDVVRGRGARDPGEYTLAYEHFAAAITRSDIRGAEQATREILRTVPRRERNGVRQRFERAADARSPLGPLTNQQRRDYLRSLPRDERRRVEGLQREWERDATAAIRRAVRNVR